MSQKRLTMHSGRKGKNGVYSTKHNDRQFNIQNADNVDPGRTPDNVYWMWDRSRDNPSKTFEKCEARFYIEHFKDYIDARNEAAERSRHLERKTDPEKLRKSSKTAPDETIYQIGTKDAHIDPKELGVVFNEFRNWRRKRYPLVQTLDMALHLDESTPHIHERVVWIAHDKDGREMPNQSASLREMSVDRPHPDKPETRYNNAKITYTEDCRTKLQEICKAHGIELITEPAEPGKKTLDLLIWQAQQEEKRLQNLKEQLATYDDSVKRITAIVQSLLETVDHEQGALYPPGVTVKEAPFTHAREVRGITPEMWEARWTYANARDEIRTLSKKTAEGLAQLHASISGEKLAALEQELKDMKNRYTQLSIASRNQPTYDQGVTDLFDAFIALAERHPELRKYEAELVSIFNRDDPEHSAPDRDRHGR